VVASAKRKKKREEKASFFFKKRRASEQRGNVLFYASLRTKRREGVFSPSAQKRKFRPHQSTSHTSGEG
jgi:hypothetical protein